MDPVLFTADVRADDADPVPADDGAQQHGQLPRERAGRVLHQLQLQQLPFRQVAPRPMLVDRSDLNLDQNMLDHLEMTHPQQGKSVPVASSIACQIRGDSTHAHHQQNAEWSKESQKL